MCVRRGYYSPGGGSYEGLEGGSTVVLREQCVQPGLLLQEGDNRRDGEIIHGLRRGR